MSAFAFLQLLLLGLIVASGPLAYVWARRGSGSRGAGQSDAAALSGAAARQRKLVWVIVFFTFDLILFGAFTRLTDSGLGCPDWPGCYGTSNPLAAHEAIKAAETAMPTGPVTLTKAWIEMIHRYLAMGVGVLLIALVAVSWRNWLDQRKDPAHAPWPALALLALVCVQGAFGAWTVTLKLMPLIVTIHLLLAVTLLCALGTLGAHLSAVSAMTPVMKPAAKRAVKLSSIPAVIPAMAPGPRAMVTLALLAVFIQIALGGWVSTNYAVLACPDFPLCHGEVLPSRADFASGFELLRPLGVRADGALLPYEALVAIHWTHRAFALVVSIAVLSAAAMVLQRASVDPQATLYARWLIALLGLQILTGVSTVVFSWPLFVAVVHNGGAAALAFVLAMLRTRFAPQAARYAPAQAVLS